MEKLLIAMALGLPLLIVMMAYVAMYIAHMIL